MPDSFMHNQLNKTPWESTEECKALGKDSSDRLDLYTYSVFICNIFMPIGHLQYICNIQMTIKATYIQL